MPRVDWKTQTTSTIYEGALYPPGYPLVVTPVYWSCDYCGSENRDEQLNCHGCGAPRSRETHAR